MSSIMAQPLQVFLDEADIRGLERWARQRGWSKSQAIRAAVRALTGKPPDESVLELSGALAALPADGRARFPRYLDETYVAESPAPCRTRRRRSAKPVRR